MKDRQFNGDRAVALVVLSLLASGTGAWSQVLAGQDIPFRGGFLPAGWTSENQGSFGGNYGGHAQVVAILDGTSRLQVGVQSESWPDATPRFSMLRGIGTIPAYGLRIEPRLRSASLEARIPAILQELNLSDGAAPWNGGQPVTAIVHVTESSAAMLSGRLRIGDSGLFTRLDTGDGSKYADVTTGAGQITVVLPSGEEIADPNDVNTTFSGEFGLAREGKLRTSTQWGIPTH